MAEIFINLGKENGTNYVSFVKREVCKEGRAKSSERGVRNHRELFPSLET